MKKVITMFVLILTVGIFLNGCDILNDQSTDKEDDSKSYRKHIYSIIDIKMPEDAVIEVRDTRGGWPSDGTYFARVTFPESKAESYSKKLLELIKEKNWQELPLREDIYVIMYNGTLDGKTYSHNFANQVGIPEVENGYWYFNDKASDKDLPLFKRTFFNFDFSIFDTDNNVLYVYNYDS